MLEGNYLSVEQARIQVGAKGGESFVPHRNFLVLPRDIKTWNEIIRSSKLQNVLFYTHNRPHRKKIKTDTEAKSLK